MSALDGFREPLRERAATLRSALLGKHLGAAAGAGLLAERYGEGLWLSAVADRQAQLEANGAPRLSGKGLAYWVWSQRGGER